MFKLLPNHFLLLVDTLLREYQKCKRCSVCRIHVVIPTLCFFRTEEVCDAGSHDVVDHEFLASAVGAVSWPGSLAIAPPPNQNTNILLYYPNEMARRKDY
jgi:hypothetical protein